MEKFSVSVNVAAAGKVNFELHYEQLLDRKLGKYELIIKVKPKQLVKDFQVKSPSTVLSICHDQVIFRREDPITSFAFVYAYA